MKRLILLLLVFLCPLMMGAVSRAPVHPTKGFYVNDYASLLSGVHRDGMFQVSTDLYQHTGVRIVLLTVSSLNGMDAAAYAGSIVDGWGLSNNDILFFVYSEPMQKGAYLLTGENLTDMAEGIDPAIEFSGNVSRSIMEPYRIIADRIYAKYSVIPSPEVQKALENPDVETKPLDTGAIIFMAVLGLAVARSFRANRKYKSKYLKGHVRKRKHYTRTYNEEDEYNNEKIYKITYDDQD